jgi:hypothetical protein
MVQCDQANLCQGHQGLKDDRHKFKLKPKAQLAWRELILMKLTAVDSYLVVVGPIRIGHESVVC